MISENKALLFNFSKNKFQKSEIFMTKKDRKSCDQIFQAVANLGKKLKIFISMFFKFQFFSKNILHFNIPLGGDFSTMLLFSFSIVV